MMTMEKSAIALRMTNGTGQFIRDYMFPKSKEDTVSTISDQLGAYREIKERVEDLENRIHLLDEISRQNLALQTTRADKIHVEQVLKYIDIESFKTKIEARSQDLMDINEKIRAREKQQNENNEKKTQLTNALVEVEAELKSSDYGQKEKELKSLKAVSYTHLVFGDNLYGRKLIKIPEPRFVVFYNGRDKMPEQSVLRLSDAYESKSEELDLEDVYKRQV